MNVILPHVKRFGPSVGIAIFAVWALRQTGYIQLTGY